MGSLEGKVAIVTGGNGVLGRETALALAGRGAEVVITCRKTELGTEAAEEIREFAEDFKRSGKPLHILVANAGANFPSKRLTTDGVPLTSQVNYLGHYTLARLLEPILIASAPSRIVSVSSVTHRFTSLSSAATFLTKQADYAETKLAQVYFTYEAQRRLGYLGVQASAVDPGGVRTNIWKGRYGRPPISWYVKAFLAPSWDGAKAVVHAATTDYSKEAPAKSRWPEAIQRKDLRFYAKGAFASPLMTAYEGPTDGILGTAFLYAFMLNTFFHSLVDWPLRNLSKGAQLPPETAVAA